MDIPKDLPLLSAESLGPFVRGRNCFSAPVLGPSCAGDGVSAYMLFTDHIVRRDPWTIFEVNLQTQAVTPHVGQMCDCWFLKLMPDGCLYVFPEDTEAEPRNGYVARVNTSTGQLEIFGPSPDAWNYCHSWGPDRALYLGGYRQRRAARFDPVTGQFLDYGVQGPEVVEGIYHIVSDDQYVYTTMGGNPYYLVACEKETNKQEILLELAWPQRAVLRRRRGVLYVIIDIQRYTPRLIDPTDEAVRCYRLDRKQLTPIDPPAEVFRPEAEVDPVDLSGTSATLLPRVFSQADGTATLWYRREEIEPSHWKPVKFEAGLSDSYLFRLGCFNDQIIGSSEDPYHLFTFSPTEGEKKILGPVELHVYGFQEALGKVYFVGYAGAPVYEWDPARPWTQHLPSPVDPTPEPASREANPRLIVNFDRQRRSYTIVAAADGRLYVPCSATVESTPGGLLGWVDPATGESGGIREGFENHRGADAALAGDGRYVVTCTCRWPQDNLAEPDMKVVTYDTQTRQVVRQSNPVPGCSDHGVLVNWRGTQVVGKVNVGFTDRSHQLPLRDNVTTTLYRYNVETNTCEVGLRIAGEYSGSLLCLASGMIACHLGPKVILIDPTDWSHRAVGTFDETPRDWILLGDDLYAILGTGIVRVPGWGRTK